MVEAVFKNGRFWCGVCGADLRFMQIDANSHNINIIGGRATGPCGHTNTVNFHKD